MPYRKQRQAPPVVYDEAAHREFVTGFRKRKQARRQSAAADATAAEKEARRQDRRARREVFRKAKEESEDELGEEGKGEEFSYAGEGDAVVTAFVTPLDSKFDRAGVSVAESKKGKESGFEGTGAVKGAKGGYVASEGGAVQNEKGNLVRTTKNVTVEGLRKTRNSRKRRVSYTHLLSKSNKRKAHLRRKAERK